MTNQYSTPDEPFEVAYTGRDLPSVRTVTSGTYQVEIISVKKKNQIVGKYAGAPILEWHLKVISGPMTKMEFKTTSMLAPEEMAWTTDRIINAVFPAIQKEQKVSPQDLVGQKFEIKIETVINTKSGQQSQWVNTRDCKPFVEAGFSGSLGDLA